MRQLKIIKQITSRDSKSLDKYLQDISKIELITIKEEIELCQKIKEGNQQAFEKLVMSNLRFVISVAKQYQNKGLTLIDLINEGNMGLMKAAKRFDDTRGFKFISYAVWWIRQGILQAIAEHSRIIRLPLNQITNISKINKTVALFEQENQRAPSPEEISLALNLAVKDIKYTQRVSVQHLSMDAPLTEGGVDSLYEIHITGKLSDTEKEIMLQSLKIEINRVLETLSPREADIIKLFYGLNNFKALNINEIAETFELTKERVRQIKEKAILKLGHASKTKILKSYLGQL